MSRSNVALLALLALLLSLPACQTARVLTNRCVAEYVVGTATLDATAAAGETRRYSLAGDGGHVGAERFDLVRAALIGGEIAADTGITWALAGTEGGEGARLVVTHRARLSAGQRLALTGFPGRRDWGPSPPPAPATAGGALFLPGGAGGESIGTQLAGTIEVLRVAPLELRLNLSATLPAAGGGTSTPLAVTGLARFRRATEERPCFS